MCRVEEGEVSFRARGSPPSPTGQFPAMQYPAASAGIVLQISKRLCVCAHVYMFVYVYMHMRVHVQYVLTLLLILTPDPLQSGLLF